MCSYMYDLIVNAMDSLKLTEAHTDTHTRTHTHTHTHTQTRTHTHTKAIGLTVLL